VSFNLAKVVSLSYYAGFVTCHNTFRHEAACLTSPQKEGVLRIFIVLKDSSPSAGYEHTNLGSNFKYANLYTTEDDTLTIIDVK
jgi:hypothetical protein